MMNPPVPVIDELSPAAIGFTVGLGAVMNLTKPKNPSTSIISKPPREKPGNDLNISAILESIAN